MLGTFSPQHEPYTYELEEETTPSGIFARGTYAARTKVKLIFKQNNLNKLHFLLFFSFLYQLGWQ
jgi:hypothetical protein